MKSTDLTTTIITLILLVSFSGCIVSLDSCKILSYSIMDENGYTILSLQVNVTGYITVKLVGTKGEILDEYHPLQGLQSIKLNFAEYYEMPLAGKYRVEVYDRYNNLIDKKVIYLNAPKVTITNINNSWWKEAKRYTLIGTSLEIENFGDAPVYVRKIEVELDDATSTAYIYNGVVKQKNTSTIYACIYIPNIPYAEHNFSVKLFDIHENLLSFANFTDIPTYNPLIKKFHMNWNYKGKRFSISLPLPKDLLSLCSSISRPPIEDYSFYVIFPYDDNYISMITEKISSLYSGEDDEDKINFIASFAQNIRYEAENGEYPQFPIELLANESGDCEDKAIFTSAILSNLGYDTALIRLPEHMGVGVHLEGVDYEGKTYFEDSSGKRYLFLETSNTGWKLGEAEDEKTKNYTLYHIEPKPILVQDCEPPVRYTGINKDYVEISSIIKNIGNVDAKDVYLAVVFINQYNMEVGVRTSELFSVDAGSEKKISFKANSLGLNFAKAAVRVMYNGKSCHESVFIF